MTYQERKTGKQLPIIRHIRWAILAWRVERHYAMWGSVGMLPINRGVDDAWLREVWEGKR